MARGPYLPFDPEAFRSRAVTLSEGSSMACGPESRVRSRLAAGETWIQTLGPSRESRSLRAGTAARGNQYGAPRDSRSFISDSVRRGIPAPECAPLKFCIAA
jgi:hypothetical protein